MARWLLGSASLLAVVALLGCAQAVPAADPPPSAESKAAAKKILGDWYAAVAGAKSFAVQIDASIKIKKEAEVLQDDAISSRLAFERPQRFALTLQKGEGTTVINDDKHLYEYSSQLQKYMVHEKPLATIGEAATSRLVQFANFGQGIGPIGHALSAKTTEEFLENYDNAALVGTEEKDGAKVQRVRITAGGMPIDLFFSGDSKLLLEMKPDIKVGMAAQGQTLPPGIDFEMSIAFKHGSYDAAPTAEAFAFAAPSGAELVEDLFEQPPHPLLGKQAPAFDTTTLDGAAIKPADLTGKVVVLDFWATWCGPCVKALPAISATAAKYKDKGVVFYAVNQQEEASIIKEFLAAQKLTVPVALDLEGKVGTAFAVEGIPQTVIIDKNGKMQVIHVGAGADIGTQLAKELDAVLAGEELADKKLKKKKAE